MIPRIVKRGDLYALCYRYTDHANKKHIKLEPCVPCCKAGLHQRFTGGKGVQVRTMRL